MSSKKRIMFAILLLLFVGLFAFIVIMQYQFMNRGAAVTTASSSETVEINESHGDNEKSETEEQTDKETESTLDSDLDNESDLPSVMYVTADLLNVRSGPGADYPISGMVTLNQEVEVQGQEDEWVKISADDVTGYVNENYLSEEVDE